jgi:hypothetical protein
VHALRRIHAALVPRGIVVDTQPVSAWPLVRDASGELGRLDMRGWLEIVEAVDERVGEVVDAGLFTSQDVASFVVDDTFASGEALAETVSNWQGTRIPAALGDCLAGHDGAAQVRQEVRLRLLRSLGGA